MSTVLLVIHLMIAAAMVGVVLMQRSEGGALGIGGGSGGGGGFMTGRGQANFLTRLTALLAIGFFSTSILLTIVGQRTTTDESIFDSTAPASSTTAPAADDADKPATETPAEDKPSGGILDKLQ